MPEFHVNFLAVGVAALTTIFIGALWYSPLLFHKVWVKAHGYSEEKATEAKSTTVSGSNFTIHSLGHSLRFCDRNVVYG